MRAAAPSACRRLEDAKAVRRDCRPTGSAPSYCAGALRTSRAREPSSTFGEQTRKRTRVRLEGVPAPSTPPLERVRVVIADDDRAFAELLRSSLTAHAEIDVVGVAKDGVEAFDLANVLKPDLVVLDVGMPRVDGIEAARRIRQLPKPPRVVLITGEDSPTGNRRAYAAGASAYLRKTTDVAAMLDLVVGVSTVTASA
ncbi:MAG: response regulator [Actinobacteria bacterium]|nr:MAG: response regulator [Actinomycetota bacterium]